MKVSNSKNLLVVLLIIGIISIIIFILDYIKFSDEVLFLTFLTLFWYAWETGKMRKEMFIQNELEQKPIVDLYYQPATSKHEKYFRLRNSGKGIAYNINIDDIKIDSGDFKFYFNDPNSILITGEEKTLHVIGNYKNKDGNECTPGDGISFFFNSVGQKYFEKLDENGFRDLSTQSKIEIIISYKNTLNKKFKRFFTIKCNGIMLDQDMSIQNDFKFTFEKEEYN